MTVKDFLSGYTLEKVIFEFWYWICFILILNSSLLPWDTKIYIVLFTYILNVDSLIIHVGTVLLIFDRIAYVSIQAEIFICQVL